MTFSTCLSTFLAGMLTFCLMLLIPPAHAESDQFELGVEAYLQENYAGAFQYWQPLADTGHSEAMYNIAIMHKLGLGVETSAEVAFQWFKKAADQKFAIAEFNLAMAYKLGHGVASDDKLAIEWLEKAARNGYPRAQFNLATYYWLGDGIKQDKSLARYWYQKAADGGDKSAIAAIIKLEAKTPEPDVGSTKTPTGEAAMAQWVQKQPPKHFTLQLAAEISEAGAKAFIVRYGISEQAVYVKSKSKGTLWYKILYGSYPTSKQAKAARSALPESLQKIKPWMRKFAAVQKELVI